MTGSELELYRDTVRRFARAEVVPCQERWREQRHVDRAIWNKAGELGLLLADLPEEYGAGGTFAHMAVFWEELVATGDTAFHAATQVHAVAARYILHSGTEEQRSTYLPQLAAGATIAAIAVTEPDAGSDIQGIRTTAVRDGEHYIINGSKTFITNGSIADLIIVVAKTGGNATNKDISLFLVDRRKVQGLRTGRVLDMVGRQGQDVCELFFDDMRVPADALLGHAEGHGFRQLMHELPYERVLIGITAVAAMERAVALTAAHAHERKAFGKPLFETQNTRFKLAEARTHAMVGRVFIDWCIGKVIEGTLENDIASMAKWYLTDLQCKVIDECLQLFGGYGYMTEYPIARMYADARVQKIYGGANEIMKEIIAYSL
jgi:acyl-CoA dehydrogenase